MKKRLKWIIPSGVLVVLVVAMVGLAATGAWFSDTNSVGPNTILAGTLQLSVDGQAIGGSTFNVTNIKPGSQPKHTWQIDNTGSIPGYLDLENIVWTQTPGLDGVGNLKGLLNGRLFVDLDGNGWIGTGDIMLYNGLLNGMASAYDANVAIPAGGTSYITLIMDWWSTPNDNLGQGDGLELNLDFELGQTEAQ